MKQIHTIVWKENTWYVAKALEVEVASQGMSEKEAGESLKEALELYFEDNKDVETINVNNPELQEVHIQVHA